MTSKDLFSSNIYDYKSISSIIFSYNTLYLYNILVINDVLLSNVRSCPNISYCINILNPYSSQMKALQHRRFDLLTLTQLWKEQVKCPFSVNLAECLL